MRVSCKKLQEKTADPLQNFAEFPLSHRASGASFDENETHCTMPGGVGMGIAYFAWGHMLSPTLKVVIDGMMEALPRSMVDVS
jgi:hypothetical protein